MLVGVIGSVLAAMIIGCFRYLWLHRLEVRMMLWCLLHRRTQIRVSVSALACFKIDDKYLLTHQVRRTHQLGPIGGAVDVFPSGLHEFQKVGFSPESPVEHKWGIERTALRGTVEGFGLIRLYRMLDRDYGRESFRECIERELVEELNIEGGVGIKHIPRFRHFAYKWKVIEGPKWLKGSNIWQWRLYRIFDYQVDEHCDADFIGRLRSEAVPGVKQFALVTEKEIRRGMTSEGMIIGSHAEYLLTKRERRPEFF